MKFSIEDIKNILKIDDFNIVNNDYIEGVCIDSRLATKGDLFIPFVGEKVDGHDYIQKAFDNGASAALTMRDINDSTKNLLKVKDSLEAIQLLAKEYLKVLGAKVIAITGSNGKTTTKDIVTEIISNKFITHKTAGNYNNELGVPLTILAAPIDTEVLVLEMGADGFGQLEELSKLTSPDFTIITNIGESHIEFFKDRKGIARGKFEINSYLKKDGYFIFNGDEPLLLDLVKNNNINYISCGENSNNDIIIKNYSLGENGSSFNLNVVNSLINTNLIGKHNSLNIAFSVALASKLGIEYEDSVKYVSNINSLTKMRLESIKYNNDSLIINDAYNASPTSMIAASSILEDLKNYNYKTLILGDMFELGPDEVIFHSKVGKYINDNTNSINKVITIGKLSKNISDNISNIETLHFFNNEDALTHLKNNVHKNEVLLFKASRGMKLEKIIENLVRLADE
ncbi:UDP-N-acetylmuramoyl-tripeptide--D-alanyl-D-alanine ligase [Gemelliphila palaticanis]|uniref:UDP-N-acetylmuramoyl-tripeptide--D-alanyl-D-alanine ligase n=1 Tax=Gemelliphila palaticanis TaxID=81950 RepID=A0ABX2T3E9_9BACL|nr:UDP-N-acetylmuramoyl-tripeptide--D-alanyl-D-alanine ligase [Gemella palaticanis]MBF0715825.1 UDP-N-acetylmuramoyl-tripeptide--D-alanyl-D-alanine ligase [Gemella palaticanis]NYS47755.1 UDP-N-acetylmuramoyl-tripeptide--D-alanyl-D-alanine ligase [Gemella palaticanis]